MENSQVRDISCVIDTDVVIDYLRGRKYARDLLSTWGRDGLLGISAMTHLEIYPGMKPHEQGSTIAFLDSLAALPVDVHLAQSAGKLLYELRRHGKTIGVVDAVIAATALSLGVPLLTNNVEHYEMDKLNVIKANAVAGPARG